MLLKGAFEMKKSFIPSTGFGKKSVEEVSKRLDTVLKSLRQSERKEVADALEGARLEVVSNNNLSDKQKEDRITILNRIGEESSREEPDSNFFVKVKDSFMYNTSIGPTSWDFITALNAGYGMGQFIDGLAQLLQEIDWGSLDIGDIDLGGF